MLATHTGINALLLPFTGTLADRFDRPGLRRAPGRGATWTLSSYAPQGEVPDRLRGRIFAVDLMLTTLAIALSQLGATAVVDHVGVRVILDGCGLITPTSSIVWRLATRRLSLTAVPGPAMI